MRFAVAAVIPKYTSSQKPRFSGIFIIKSRYPGGLEKMYLGGKTQQWEPWLSIAQQVITT